MKTEQKVLVLLHSKHPDPVNEDNLFDWTEYSHKTTFRKILIKLHKVKLIEYDKNSKNSKLSPIGIESAEEIIKQHN